MKWYSFTYEHKKILRGNPWNDIHTLENSRQLNNWTCSQDIYNENIRNEISANPCVNMGYVSGLVSGYITLWFFSKHLAHPSPQKQIYRELANVSFPSKSILRGGVGEMIREELQDYIARYQTWDISLTDPWISTYFIMMFPL